ncbi:MAG: hypothetical protein F6K22_09405 [Okeania sp. SIO2F4]|uniref:hypothetical protein n=1 Tax=Okeania sp. SIO2F4 TaxID=2607790 RepID=UPI00142CD726|nr:hypothetical protein [Okeania sp. SIO2F4]NES03049.1 hypothetical protein [Okeania sp. SIO2F4]
MRNIKFAYFGVGKFIQEAKTSNLLAGLVTKPLRGMNCPDTTGLDISPGQLTYSNA